LDTLTAYRTTALDLLRTDRAARAAKLSRSEFIRRAIADAIERQLRGSRNDAAEAGS
jgi:metal-responsive CopG/Arc/MetJ family transcriptional regulator